MSIQSSELVKCICPGYLSLTVRADDRRCEFDCKNQTLLQKKTPIDLLFIGDSIIQMWELPAYFNERNLCVINRGIGGDRTSYLLYRFKADALQLKPRICIVMVGINDSWQLEEDHFRPSLVKTHVQIASSALANITELIQISRQAGQKIAICSILPTNMYWTEHEKERNQYVKLYNSGLKDLCETNLIAFIDFYPLFQVLGEDKMNMKLSVEGLHPNVFGYDCMFSELKQYLLKNLPEWN